MITPEAIARLEARLLHLQRRAEILRAFADKLEHDDSYWQTATDDADGSELEAADLRALLADHARLTEGLEGLRTLSERAAAGPWFVRDRPTNEGLAEIEDGRADGLFPIMGEWFEIEFVVAAINFVRRVLGGEG